MVWSDEVFNKALKISKRAGKKGRYAQSARELRNAGATEFSDVVRDWAKNGTGEMRDPALLFSGSYEFQDAAGQEMQADKSIKRWDKTTLQNKQYLIVGQATSGVPEYSRNNVGGLCLKELARMCGATWKREPGGYSCTLTANRWYTPSNEKKFLNRHYADQRQAFIKNKLLGLSPQCTLFVPTVEDYSVPREILNFMYKHKFHSDNTLFVSADRAYPLGMSKFRNNMDRDEVFLKGVPLNNMSQVKDMKGLKGYTEAKRKLGNMMVLRLGVGDSFPDNPMIVFGEKERVFLHEYQLPLVHHSIFLLAAGMPPAEAQEAVQRQADVAKQHMENTEYEHLEASHERENEELSQQHQQAEEAEAAAAEEKRAVAAHRNVVATSALGRFVKRKAVSA